MKIRFGDYTLDTATRQLWLSGSTVHLSPKAFELLKLLIERRPSAVSKPDLHERMRSVADRTGLTNDEQIRVALARWLKTS